MIDIQRVIVYRAHVYVVVICEIISRELPQIHTSIDLGSIYIDSVNFLLLCKQRCHVFSVDQYMFIKHKLVIILVLRLEDPDMR